MDFETWTQKVINTISEKVAHQQNFQLRGLFEECEWEQLEKGERIAFGKYFANEVREGKIKGVISIERLKNNHSQYQKI